MINIADILKDCPNGTKLYSPICGECRLIKIYDSLGFDVINDTDEVFNFSYDGRFNLNGECCIFPSKENRNWNKFQPFKDGDIIYVKSKNACSIELISIYKKEYNERLYAYCSVPLDGKYFYPENVNGLIHINDIGISRFATKDEKIKLFKAIKANGYKWNAETKTLEKLIIPKFKVGDIIKYKKHDIKYRIINEENDMYIVERCTDNFTCHMSFKYVDDEYELVPNKFDISTLKAYDKVLVRDDNNSVWVNTFFGFYDTVTNKKYPFIAGSVNWAQCIPYEGNEYLLGTNNDCDEYYK